MSKERVNFNLKLGSRVGCRKKEKWKENERMDGTKSKYNARTVHYDSEQPKIEMGHLLYPFAHSLAPLTHSLTRSQARGKVKNRLF